MDVFVNNVFIKILINCEIVCGIVSEEEDDFIIIKGRSGNNDNKYVVFIDFLDGFLNIDVNVLVGIIFFIYCWIIFEGILVIFLDFL